MLQIFVPPSHSPPHLQTKGAQFQEKLEEVCKTRTYHLGLHCKSKQVSAQMPGFCQDQNFTFEFVHFQIQNSVSDFKFWALIFCFTTRTLGHIINYRGGGGGDRGGKRQHSAEITASPVCSVVRQIAPPLPGKVHQQVAK